MDKIKRFIDGLFIGSILAAALIVIVSIAYHFVLQ
jgi:hypothetical protein